MVSSSDVRNICATCVSWAAPGQVPPRPRHDDARWRSPAGTPVRTVSVTASGSRATAKNPPCWVPTRKGSFADRSLGAVLKTLAVQNRATVRPGLLARGRHA